MKAFAKGIRAAARCFAQGARATTDNELHDEIVELYRAAQRREYDVAADRLERLSERARERLEGRAKRIDRDPNISRHGQRVTAKNRRGQDVTRTPATIEAIKLPSPIDLRNEASRDAGCEQIERLCSFGLIPIEGRLRPSGRRSRAVLKPLPFAPARQKNFPKRDAERNFLFSLRITWIEATGVAPPRAARQADDSRKLGPFAAFVRECLRLVGAADANVVELINELHRRTRAIEHAEARRRRRAPAHNSNGWIVPGAGPLVRAVGCAFGVSVVLFGAFAELALQSWACLHQSERTGDG
jgi:hypothetical protein